MPYYSDGSKSDISESFNKWLSDAILKSSKDDSLLGTGVDLATGWAKKKVIDFIKNKLGILGNPLIDHITQAIAEENGMKAEMLGIELLAERNIPGFVYKEVYIDGQKYRIGVDASGQADKPGQEPRVIVERVIQNGFPQDDSGRPMERPPNLKEGELATHISAMKNKASADIAEFRQNNEVVLKERQRDYVERIKEFAEKVNNVKPEDIHSIPAPKVGSRYSDLLKELITEASGSILAELNRDKQPQAAPKSAMALTAG